MTLGDEFSIIDNKIDRIAEYRRQKGKVEVKREKFKVKNIEAGTPNFEYRRSRIRVIRLRIYDYNVTGPCKKKKKHSSCPSRYPVKRIFEKTNPMPAFGRKLEFLNPKSETRIELVFIRGSFSSKNAQKCAKRNKNENKICVHLRLSAVPLEKTKPIAGLRPEIRNPKL